MDWQAGFGPAGVPVVTTARVDPHDAAAANPSPDTIDATAWQGFGSIDQTRLAHLVRHFGPWTEGAAAARVAELRTAAPADVRDAVSQAFARHYADEGPDYIEGALLLRDLRERPGSHHTEGGDLLQQAAHHLDELAALAQWDLYHLVSAPDLVAFHGGEKTPLETRLANIARGYHLYAGYSWTPDLGTAIRRYGPVVYAIALPVRIVALSWRVPYVDAARDQSHIFEVAPAARLVLDPASSLAFAGDARFAGGNAALRELVDRFTGRELQAGTSLDAIRALLR